MSERSLGPFDVQGKLGVGGMGIVYQATYRKNGKQVALKVLAPNVTANPKVLARFEREMDILEKLRHPGIVRYYGGRKQGTQWFYAMELMDAGSLEDELQRLGTIPWERVIDVAAQTCEALQYAHAAGVIHRDLKPGNLFASRNGTVKLGDFGIARDMEATALTEAGKTVGTYAYMAPEQISGKPPVSHKTDLYALGCVMFQMLTGRPPFEADTSAQMLMKHLEEPPPRIRHLAPDCPVWLESLIQRLMSKDPADRPHDALATKVALEEVREKVAKGASVSGATVAGGPTQLTMGDIDRDEVGSLVRKKRKKKKKPAGPFWEQTWFLAVCLVAIIGVLVWGFWPPSEEELYADARELWTPIAGQIEDGAERLEGTYDARASIEKLLDRYPEGTHADEVREWLDEIETYRVERESIRVAQKNEAPESEAQRLFIDALGYENFGDRVTALAKYRAMIDLLKNREEDRPYLRIANRRAERLESAGNEAGDRVEIVRTALDRADSLYAAGNATQAAGIWRSIVTLYGTEPELAALVERARQRLDETSR